MNTIRPCGCKGCRTCLLCEDQFNLDKPSFYKKFQDLDSYVFCPTCNRVFAGWDVDKSNSCHLDHNLTNGVEFPGIYVLPNFLSTDEARDLMENLDRLPWQISQSGRRKQNFGPKTNFKKKKLKNGEFAGFPKCSQFIQDRFRNIPLLDGFQTIEQCSLEYNPDKGASIDPHIDDCWIWGERVVTVNCLGDSVLTLSPYTAVEERKYNCDLINGYRDKLLCDLFDTDFVERWSKSVIRIPMPNLSLIVLFGPPRYQFEHSVLREDIKLRRVCIAYREFTPMYLQGGCDQEKGDVVRQNARKFWSIPPDKMNDK